MKALVKVEKHKTHLKVNLFHENLTVVKMSWTAFENDKLRYTVVCDLNYSD